MTHRLVLLALLLLGLHAFLTQAFILRRHISLLEDAETRRGGVLRELPALWFSQNLDHFDRQEKGTFQQRYYVNDEFHKQDGPVFLYIGGEGALRSTSLTSGEIVDLAQARNGLLVALEHRYYGESHPFKDLGQNASVTENLKYLSSMQALADLSWFQHKFSEENDLDDANWFCVGGSYPGSLSAWYRLKFPHLVVGSIASSAPVEAKKSFYEYDQVVGQSAGSTCAQAIHDATAAVEAELDAHPDTTKEAFTCSDVEDNVDFLYVLADAVSFAIQYTSTTEGSPYYHMKEKMCSDFTQEGTDPVQAFESFIKYLLDLLQTDCGHFTSTYEVLSDTSYAEMKNARQWWYQSCTEFGYFQVAPTEGLSLRSQRIDLPYHLQLCERVFGIPLDPNVTLTNKYYGAKDVQEHGHRILMPNGSLDPWHALSVITMDDDDSTVIPFFIDGTAHCADLHAISPSDPASLTQARKSMARFVNDWLDDPDEYDDGNDDDDDDISAGAVVGIAIGCSVAFLILGLIAGVLGERLRRRRIQRRAQVDSTPLAEAAV